MGVRLLYDLNALYHQRLEWDVVIIGADECFPYCPPMGTHKGKK